MFDRITFILGEWLASIRRNLGMVILGIITVSVCIFITGGLALTYLGILKYGQALSDKFEMRVFLKDKTSVQQISVIAQKIRLMDGVATVNWIPRDKAWAKFKAENPEKTKDLDNIFPDAYKIVLKDLSKSEGLAVTIQALPEVEPDGVKYLQNTQKQVEESLRFLKWIGLVAGGLLALVSGVLIYIVVRLTAMSRRLELRIMSLVGATYTTIYTPLLLEGTFQGAVGGVVASLLLRVSYNQLQSSLGAYPYISGLAAFPTNPVFIACSAAGAAYGLLCSILALINLRGKMR